MQTNLRIAVLLVCSLFFNGTSAQTPNWKNIGPILFPKKTVDQIQGIGRCIQIKFHPSDPNKMYVASASGGLYQSNDKGLHWTSLGTDQVANTTSSSIAIDPTNDQVIYWGTGDANNSYDGLGVYKTINGGTTCISIRSLTKSHIWFYRVYIKQVIKNTLLWITINACGFEHQVEIVIDIHLS